MSIQPIKLVPTRVIKISNTKKQNTNKNNAKHTKINGKQVFAVANIKNEQIVVHDRPQGWLYNRPVSTLTPYPLSLGLTLSSLSHHSSFLSSSVYLMGANL